MPGSNGLGGSEWGDSGPGEGTELGPGREEGSEPGRGESSGGSRPRGSQFKRRVQSREGPRPGAGGADPGVGPRPGNPMLAPRLGLPAQPMGGVSCTGGRSVRTNITE